MTTTALLIATLLKATLLLAVLFALVALLRGRSAALRHLVWSAGLAGLLVLPILALALPWRIPMLPAAGPAPEIAATPSWAVTGGGRTFDRPAGERASVSPAPPSGSSRTSASTPGVPLSARLPELLIGLWLAGAALVLGRLLAGLVSVRRLARGAEPLAAEEWGALLRSAGRRVGLGTSVRLLASPAATMPITFGIVRPTVVLPASAARWDDDRRRAVLLHELAHVQRGDLAPHVLAWVACALYWFHPLVWLAAARLRHEGERACDDLVLTAGTRPSDYAGHLLEIARAAGRRRAPAAAVPMAQRSRFEGRLLAILEPDVRRHRVTVAGVAGAAALLGLVVVPLAALGPAAPDEGAGAARGEERPGGKGPADGAASPGREAAPAGTAWAPLRLDERGAIEELPGLGGLMAVAGRATAQDTPAGVDGRVSAALVDALRDPIPGVRAAAVQALGELADPRSVEALARVLREDPEPEVRRMVAWALGQIEDPAAVPALAAALGQDRSAEVRAMAAWALGEIESADGVRALGEALADESAEVREKALWALGQVESVEAVPWLVRALGDPSVEARRQAVWALGEIESAEAVEPLIGMLDDRDAEVRGTAIWALGEIQDPRAVPAIVPALADGDVEVRRKAVWAIGELEPPSAPAALIDATRDGDAEVRKTAAWALGEIGDGAAVPALRALLRDGEPEVRKTAVWALIEMDDPAAYEILVELLKDEDPEVREAAAHALGDR